jgi:hypothetical protein
VRKKVLHTCKILLFKNPYFPNEKGLGQFCITFWPIKEADDVGDLGS